MYRDFVLPEDNICGYPHHLYFNRPRRSYKCNFASEWAIFLGAVFSDFLKIVLALLFLSSVYYLFRCILYLTIRSFVVQTKNLLPLTYIRYGIDRIEKEHEMMNRFFTPGTSEFELDGTLLYSVILSDISVSKTPSEKKEIPQEKDDKKDESSVTKKPKKKKKKDVEEDITLNVEEEEDKNK